MGKSLGDYNIEKSSSANMNNIKWSQKNPKDIEKTKKKKPDKLQKTSASNIIYTKKTKSVEKVFKVEEDDTEKTKKKNADKRHQKSSSSNCNIEQGFKRPGR